jgi:hypothetical protein
MGTYKQIRQELGRVMLATVDEVRRRSRHLERLSISELKDLAELELEAQRLLEAARELKASPRKIKLDLAEKSR